jgi:hypothetical protein
MIAKLRLFTSTTLAMAAAAITGGLFLSRPHPVSATPRQLLPTYVTGSFTFSTPLELDANWGQFSAADAEPEIKVDIFGNIYVTAIQGVPAGTDFWKSTDKGANFAYLGQPDGAQDHCQILPQCVAGGGGDDSIAVSNGGYLYVSSLWLGSVTMSASYDGGIGGTVPGQRWEVNPAAATIPGDDRQWIAAYGPQTVYMSYTDIGTGVIDFEKSTDGGKTFGAPVQTYPITSSILSDVQGNMVVDQYNGNIYICFVALGADNQVYINRSTDGGSTWTLLQAYNGPAGTGNAQVFPTMAVDRGGNVYVAFSACGAGHTNCQIEMVSSTDQGTTWSSALRVSNGAATATAVEPTIAAGSPGVVDVTWLGSSAATPDVLSNWHVFFAQVTNALTSNPTIAQDQAEVNVMHKWDICFNGTGCASNPHQSPGNRDLLEYYSMTIDADGNANIAYADSVTNCPDATCITHTFFMKQTAGPSAYNPPALPQPATFAMNLSMPNSSGTGEPNSWVDSYNCIFGGAIGGPIDFISKDTGLSFTEHAVVLGTGLHGGDFDIKTIPNANGARPDQIYTADLGVTTVHIGKSTDGGNTYFQPGTMGAAGEVSVSSDRMWLWPDRGVPTAPDQTIYLMDHEFTTEAVRFSALTNDVAWSPFTSGMTASELILPPTSTLPNTNPGNVFVDNSHNVYGIFAASSTTTNTQAPPFGKEPNVWDAVGAPPAAGGLPPGPFTNHPVFKGVIDSPTQAPSPAPTIPPSALTYGNSVANIFPSGVADKAGNVYVVWSTNSSRLNTVQSNNNPSTTFDIWFASSHDGGQNFYGPWKVSSGVGTSVFPWIAAGDAGRVDISWYQTSAVAPPLVADPSNPGALTGGPNNMPPGASWNVMFAQSLNANSREPVFTVSQASDHIIHTGSISNGGLFGSSDRSLLDFFQVAIGPDGLGNIFCADNDSTGPGTTHINYMRQNSGPLAVANPSAVTCVPVPVLTRVDSVMMHGSAGSFAVNMPLPPMSSPRGVECRSSVSLGARNYTLVFTFSANLTSVAGATVTAHNPSSATGTVSGTFLGPGLNQCTVNLTNVSNAQYLTVTLNNVTDMAGNAGNVVSPQMGVLIGDVDATIGVDGNDVAAVQSHTRQAVNSDAQARFDVNATGAIDGNDVALTQSHTRTSLPTPP